MFTTPTKKLFQDTHLPVPVVENSMEMNQPFISSAVPYWIPEIIDEGVFEKEYDDEWKNYLMEKNMSTIKMAAINKYRFNFYTPNLVRVIFNICKLLKQPPDVRYLAVDIFDRFLADLFLDVTEAFRKMEDVDESDWQAITERMLNQSLLRILTCIQIAIKYCSNCNTVTVKTLQEVMTFLKHPNQYSKRNIIKSELRIYKTLNYDISCATPLTYVEMLFEEFQRQIFYQYKRPALCDFFKSCLYMLDVALVHHQQVYCNLNASAKKIRRELLVQFNDNKTNMMENYDMEEDGKILRIAKGDFLSLAASIVFAASVLHDLSTEFSQYFFGSSHLTSPDDPKKINIIALAREILKII